MGIKAGSIPYATAASPGCGVHCEGARLDGEAAKVKPQARRSTAAKKPLKAARMTSAKLPEPKRPEQCETMTEVRAGVDQVDRDRKRVVSGKSVSVCVDLRGCNL